jgi:predicted dithiol-disulfide oxidoreductase (DUF899 family)
MSTSTMNQPKIASPEEWLEARKQLLAREKELTGHRDEVNAERRRLPMVEITKDYVFEGPEKAGLVDLFDGRSQLLVFHFMFEPDWDEGCPSCSYIVDNIGHLSHLHARDTSLVLVSRAPFEKLAAYRERMGWTVPWYSSFGSDFNYDFHVTIDKAVAPVEYNYKSEEELVEQAPSWAGWSGDQPGVTALLREDDRVFHTYSGYERGVEVLMGTYTWLDLTARGRQEDWEEPQGRGDEPAMGWLHRHDQYEDD